MQIRNLFCLGALAVAMTAQAATLSLDVASPRLELTENGRDAVNISWSFSDLDVQNVQTEQGTFSLLTGEGLTHSMRLGEPSLPMLRKIISVPLEADVNARILDATETTLDLMAEGVEFPLMPTQPSLFKNQLAEEIAFEYDEAVYRSAGFSGLPTVQIEELGIMRGMRLVALQVEPFQYDAANHQLRIMNDLDIQIDWTGADWAATDDLKARTASPYFEGTYKSRIFNYDAPLRDDLVRDPVKYVIVTHSMFEAQMAPFVEWKTQKGFEVIVGVVGSAEVGSSTTSIKSYLQGLYNAGTPESPAPSFVLYVGDDNLVPTWSGDTGSHVTDLDYVLYSGGDYLPEVYYGRFSARDAADLQPQIDKTVEYERYEMADPSFLNEVVMTAGVDSGYAPSHGNGQINYGTNLYFNAAHGITSHTYLYPLSDESWVSAAIIGNVSDGAGYVNYTAHGSQTSWGDPSFTISNINGLSNAGKYPTVVGNCCLTNSFQITECFGEAWLRAANKGAIGYIGGSNNTQWDEDYWWGVGAGPVVSGGPTYSQTGIGVYDGLFHDHSEPTSDWYTTQGGMLMAGNLAVVEGGSSSANYYWEIYHLMGDPSLSTYLSVPSANAATLPGEIFLGAGSTTIIAEPYSYVGLSRDGVLYASGLVGSSGSLTLNFTPFTIAGDADLVVTKQNCQPIITTIPLIPNDGAYVSVAAVSPVEVDFTDAVSVDMTLENAGTVGATSVSAEISSADAFVTISDDTQYYGTIMPGATSTENGAFAYSLISGVPDQHSVHFDVAVTGTERDQWDGVFNVLVNAPELDNNTVQILDSAFGNGNGRMDAGETVTVRVPVENSGHAAATSVVADLSSASIYLDITTSHDVLGTVNAGATSFADFTVVVDGGAPVGTPVAMTLAVEAGAYSFGNTLNFNIGLVLEDFETGGFTSFAWEMSGNADWIISGDAHDGSFSAVSGDINDYQTSTLSLTSDVSATGDISFWYSVSSEASYDFLRFYIDGTERSSWAGTVGWTQASYSVDPGTHTFMWSYTKDVSVSTGSDCAWIDDIIFPALGAPAAPAMTITPASIEKTLEPGTIGTEYLTISNGGEGELNWAASVAVAAPAMSTVETIKLRKGEADPRVGSMNRDADGPDTFGYSWIDSNEPDGPNYNWFEINSLGTDAGSSDDGNFGPFDLGFTFSFYGQDYTSLNVCSNGFLSFTSSSTAYNNAGIPVNDDTNNLLAVMWDDLNPTDGGSIYYYADTDRFIVEWDAVPHYGNAITETFQAIIHADGHIVYQYASVGIADGCTVGIENADGTDGLQVVFNAAYLTDGLAIQFASELVVDPWIALGTTSGVVAAGGSQQIAVDLSALDLTEGVYYANVTVTGNDAGNPSQVVPVTLTVGTLSIAAPVISINSPTNCTTMISWDAIPGADYYQVYVSSTGYGPWELESTTSYLFHQLECISSDFGLFYRVVAIDMD